MTITALTPEQAEREIDQLVDLLIDAVDSGASIGFMPPLDRSEAIAYWRDVIAAMSAGHRIMLAALDDDLIQGSIQLALEMRANGNHRAEAMKLFVHRLTRRRGLARALMIEAESTARALGRTLLVMDTRKGGEAEKLCESLGYVRFGEVPEYARSGDGALHTTVFFYRQVDAPVVENRLIICDPGNFHASLLQKEMYPWLASRVSVYAPLGPDVLDYLNRVSRFNSRRENPTRWETDIHLSADPMGELLRDRPGNIVVFAGRNRGKIDRILACLSAGLNVLADKPWIIDLADLPKLEEALALAKRKNLAAYDIMTERYEITSELQREFVSDAEVFGSLEEVTVRSIHHLMKTVAGVPLRRPAWFFDVSEYGEGLADVGTHVVDLVQWTAFANEAIDYRKDIEVIEGRRWPLTLTKEQFAQVTGEPRESALDYYCNNAVYYTIRGAPVKIEIEWHWEAPEGSGDTYEASFRGTKARVEIRQEYVPELYIVPARIEVLAAARRKVAELQAKWPGLDLTESDGELRLTIPEKFRVGHEAHFAQVTNRFFDYVRSPGSMPEWERVNMLAKYYVSTKGVALARC